MKGVLRRTRLPLVVSLFLAALLGAPTAAGPVTGPLPVPAAAASAARATPTATAVAAVEIVTSPPAAPAAPAGPVLIAAPLLADQVSTTAGGPRGPPATA